MASPVVRFPARNLKAKANRLVKERRSAPRVRVNLPARWEGVLFRNKASVTDISRSGCFILTGGKVEMKELISLEIELPSKHWIHFWAEVVDEANEIGFAVKFNSGSFEDQELLEEYIAKMIKVAPAK
jgi:PilZ domain